MPWDVELPPPEERTPDLDRPPKGSDGETGSVNFEARSSTAADRHTQLCQECGTVVHWNRTHTLAMVRMQKPKGTRWLRVRFCDRACWAEWARSD